MADARPAVALSEQPEQPPHLAKPVLWAAVLGLALLVVGAVMFAVPQRANSGGEPARNVQIVAATSEFVTQYNSYDAADLAGYRKRLDGLMTEGFAADNDKTTATYFEILKPKKQISKDPKIKSVAVEDSDSDSARVLVAVDATVSNTDLKEPALSQMRWIVNLQKEGGSWKVDSFESVAALPASGQASKPTPSASPTTGGDAE